MQPTNKEDNTKNKATESHPLKLIPLPFKNLKLESRKILKKWDTIGSKDHKRIFLKDTPSIEEVELAECNHHFNNLVTDPEKKVEEEETLETLKTNRIKINTSKKDNKTLLKKLLTNNPNLNNLKHPLWMSTTEAEELKSIHLLKLKKPQKRMKWMLNGLKRKNSPSFRLRRTKESAKLMKKRKANIWSTLPTQKLWWMIKTLSSWVSVKKSIMCQSLLNNHQLTQEDMAIKEKRK